MFSEFGSVLTRLRVACSPVCPSDHLEDIQLQAGEVEPRSVLFAQTDVPPTMKQGKYTTSVCLLVEEGEERAQAKSVLSADCTCKAGYGRRCSHVACLLYLLEQFFCCYRARHQPAQKSDLVETTRQ